MRANETQRRIIRDLEAYREESANIKKRLDLENTLENCKCPRCRQNLASGFIEESHEGRLEPTTIREVWRCYDCGWWSDQAGAPFEGSPATVIHRLGKVKVKERDKIL